MAFGISDEAIRRALANKGRISTNDIHLDEEHPPPQALGFCLIHIKPYVNADAWKRISTASMLFCCSCIMDQVKFITAPHGLYRCGVYRLLSETMSTRLLNLILAEYVAKTQNLTCILQHLNSKKVARSRILILNVL